jgi:alanyl-tRNA synthetase
MTERLYYVDSVLASFDATVVSTADADGRPGVILDRTAFYPSSGGQPFDTGRLGTATVVDVIDRDDGEIVHVLDGPLPSGATVHGEIDWPRRFDHMQQHTGQHVLSAAFDRLFGVRTVSFHLGAEVSTIDLSREVTPAEVAAAETESCRVVWDDVGVVVRFVSEDEARALAFRKEPVRSGPLRIVEVPGFDISACGGTHVPRTGMIGIIAVAGAERFKGGSRVTFVCGTRTLVTYRRLRDVVAAATRSLSVSPAEVVPAIERFRAEARDAAKALRRAQEELAGHQAALFRREAQDAGGLGLVLKVMPDWDAAALKTLASAIVSEPGLVVVAAGGGRPVPVVIARSKDVDLDAGAWMTRAAAALGGRGGGRPELAQGGLTADPDAVLAFARDTVRGSS